MDTPDVVIIGGGIIGCSLARELARAGQKVVVLDRGRAGAAASSAAAGLLSPTLAAPYRPEAAPGTAPHQDPLIDLCFQSADLYESWVNELREDGAGDVGFRRPGLMELWTREEKAETPPGGRRAEVLSASELRRREPAVGPAVTGATFYPDDAQVDAASISRAVARVAELKGAVVKECEPVLRLSAERERITGVQTATASYHPGTVVLAAGAWSGALVEPLGISLPTRPVKGQMLMADCRVPPVRTPLHTAHALFVPRPDGRLTLRVTVEEVGFDDRVTLDAVRSILQNTSALVPAVGQLPLGRAWAGLRPATPDAWPYMGPVPPWRNLWVNTGHFRKGILLAPVCARLVARSILGGRLEKELVPFDPARRVTAGAT